MLKLFIQRYNYALQGFELDIITTFLYVKTNKKGWLSIRIDGALMLYNFNRHPPLGFNASAVENKNVHFFKNVTFPGRFPPSNI